MFTPEELSAMAAADAEIEADFCLTQEEIEQSRARDRRAAFEALPFEKKKVAARQKAYREANREKIAARQKAWYEANREKIAARQKAWYEANREKIAAQQKAHREANREKYNAYHRAYYHRRKETSNENNPCPI